MRDECKFCQHLNLGSITASCNKNVVNLDDSIPCPFKTEPHHGKIYTCVESDPTGRKPNDPGAKLDQGKNRLGLVMFGFAKALQEVCKVGTYGAQKYSDNGWMQVPDGQSRYTDALMRHLMKEAEGEEIDPETNLRHAAQVAWNALSRLELMLREKETKTTKGAT